MSAVGYRVNWPSKWISPVIVASPHSGAQYPQSFLERSALDALQIRSSEDAFVDKLFEAAPGLGLAFLTAV